jgi:hypothetical protein
MQRIWKASVFARAIMRTSSVRQRQKGRGNLKTGTLYSPAVAKEDSRNDAPVAAATLRTSTHTFATDETSISLPQRFVLKFLVMTEQKLAAPQTARGTSEVASNTSVAETDHPKLEAGAHAVRG